MKVYLVMCICDDEYFCREVVFVASNYDNAVEWVERHGGFHEVIGWDDKARPYWTVEEWVVDR